MTTDDDRVAVGAQHQQEKAAVTARSGRTPSPLVQISRVIPRSAAATLRASRPQAAPVPRLQLRPTAWPLVFFDDLLITLMTMRQTAHTMASDFDQTVRDAEETVRQLDAAGLLAEPEGVYCAPPAPATARNCRHRDRAVAGSPYAQRGHSVRSPGRIGVCGRD